MHRLNLKAGLVLVLIFSSIESDCGFGYVDKAVYDKQSKELEDAKKKLDQLQKQLAAKPEHHYSLERVGSRTFRFDSSTGDSCIALTTDADWKKPQTQMQSCNCTDLFRDSVVPDKSLREIQCGF